MVDQIEGEKLRRAGEVLRLALQKLRPLLDAADVLENIGSLETASNEAKRQHAVSLKERDDANAVVQQAKEKAKMLSEKAASDASEVVAAAEEKPNAARAEETAVRDRIKTANSELASVQQKLSAARAQLEDLRGRASALLS
jgi:uncharacterized protein (DUF3084 family)